MDDSPQTTNQRGTGRQSTTPMRDTYLNSCDAVTEALTQSRVLPSSSGLSPEPQQFLSEGSRFPFSIEENGPMRTDIDLFSTGHSDHLSLPRYVLETPEDADVDPFGDWVGKYCLPVDGLLFR